MSITAGDTGAPYTLPYPGDSSVADVPQDIKNLADKTATALSLKVDKSAVGNGSTNTVQKKIYVQVGTGTPVPPSGVTFVEGDIVFMIPGP